MSILLSFRAFTDGGRIAYALPPSRIVTDDLRLHSADGVPPCRTRWYRLSPPSLPASRCQLRPGGFDEAPHRIFRYMKLLRQRADAACGCTERHHLFCRSDPRLSRVCNQFLRPLGYALQRRICHNAPIFPVYTLHLSVMSFSGHCQLNAKNLHISAVRSKLPLNQSTGDSYTRYLGHADITRLRGLSSVPMLYGLI